MITATTMSYGTNRGTGRSEHASFTIHNGAKMISVSVDNSGGRMSHMARADIRCLLSHATAGRTEAERVEDVTSLVFGGGKSDIVRGNADNMATAMNWLRRTCWGFQNDI